MSSFGGVYSDTYHFSIIDSQCGKSLVLYYPQDNTFCKMPLVQVEQLPLWVTTHIKFTDSVAEKLAWCVKNEQGTISSINNPDVLVDVFHEWMLTRWPALSHMHMHPRAHAVSLSPLPSLPASLSSPQMPALLSHSQVQEQAQRVPRHRPAVRQAHLQRRRYVVWQARRRGGEQPAARMRRGEAG